MPRKILSFLVLSTWLLAACAQTPGAATPQVSQAADASPAVQNTAVAPQASAPQSQCTVIALRPTPGPTEDAIIPPVGERDWTKGPADAYVTILEYSDFM